MIGLLTKPIGMIMAGSMSLAGAFIVVYVGAFLLGGPAAAGEVNRFFLQVVPDTIGNIIDLFQEIWREVAAALKS